jgi:hypothetical protein
MLALSLNEDQGNFGVPRSRRNGTGFPERGACPTSQFTVLEISVNIIRSVLIEPKRLRVRRSSTGRGNGSASVLEVGLPLGQGKRQDFCFLIIKSFYLMQEASEWRCNRHETDPNL